MRLKSYFIIILAFIVLSTPNGTEVTEQDFSSLVDLEQPTAMKSITKAHTPHDPIVIASDADFEAQDWPGNGSETDPYLISGLNITSLETAIRIQDTTVHFEIKNCIVTANQTSSGDGIDLYNVAYGFIRDTIIEGYFHGIRVRFSTNVLLRNNTLEKNTESGILLYESESCELEDNIFVDNGLVIFSDSVSRWVHSISDNMVNDKPLGYFANATNEIINGSLFGQVILANCSGVTIVDGIFANVSKGVQLGFSSDCTLTDNIASYNHRGFYLHRSLNNTLEGNIAFDNSDGFHLTHSSTLKRNMATGNTFGFYLTDSVILINNTASDNAYGFHLENADGSLLVKNTAANSIAEGFKLESSQGCNLTDNIAINNRQGFALSYSDGSIMVGNTASNNNDGFEILSSSFCNLTNNEISHSRASGIYLDDSTGCILKGNTLTSNGVVISGTSISHWFHKVSGNVVNSKPLGYFANVTHEALDISEFGQLIIVNCADVTFRDGTFVNASIGLQMAFSTNCTLSKNTAMENMQFGFRIYSSTSIVMTDNEAVNNLSNGFFLYEVDASVLIDSILSGNGRGVTILHSTNISVTKNSVSGGDFGFALWDSEDLTLTHNVVDGYYTTGIYLSHTDASQLMNNLVTGIINGQSEHSIHLTSACSNNSIYLNRLAYNSLSNAQDDGASNSWDDGVSTGNCWDDYDGTGAYTIPGTAGSIDSYPVKCPPTIHGPGHVQYEAGTTGHSIVWNALETYPDRYEIYLDGLPIIDSEWNGSEIVINIDNLLLGVHNYTLVVNDTLGNKQRDTVLVEVVDTTPPTIDHPSNIQYEAGTTGHNIIWNPSDLYPHRYEVYRNDSVTQHDSWNGSAIVVGIDGLSLGTYNYTIVVYDTSDNSNSDTVLVLVEDTTAPTIDSPEHIEYEEGDTGFNITWNPSDLYPYWYNLYQNGSLIEEGAWNGTLISVSVDDLNVGTYNYTLVVYDTSGNWNRDTVFVSVLASTTTTTTTTTETTTDTETDTTTTTTEPITEPLVPDSLILIGAAATAGILLVSALAYLRKKQ